MKESGVGMENAYRMLDLICAMLDRRPYDISALSEEDMESLLQTARFHSLSAMTADALEYQGVRDKGFTSAKAMIQRRSILYGQKLKEVSSKLSERHIRHMPLKGMILKDFYPAFYQREMKDVDILCDPGCRAQTKELMEELGFTVMSYMELNDDVYHLQQYYSFEMHFELFGVNPDRRYRDYYNDISDRLLQITPYELRFTPEDFYIYNVLHTYKHFIGSGIGVRYLLDAYMYLRDKENDLSWDYLRGEFEKLGITEFEASHRTLAKKVFSGQPLTEEDKRLLEQYLLYGTHGTYNHMIQNAVKNSGGKGGKGRYLIKRAFPSGDELTDKYSFFRDHRALLPILWLYRPVRAVCKYPASLVDEIRALRKVDR